MGMPVNASDAFVMLSLSIKLLTRKSEKWLHRHIAGQNFGHSLKLLQFMTFRQVN
ncbi:hypothetical protein [Sphingobium sp. EM0848]|uniref:hypothetical protein n=1 Tax=Sphingobium sp. EM0848 TaxID=2743473 RepID=UPI00159C137D|nr:hypothetical protein [Sphingobium sp. EM0848]